MSPSPRVEHYAREGDESTNLKRKRELALPSLVDLGLLSFPPQQRSSLDSGSELRPNVSTRSQPNAPIFIPGRTLPPLYTYTELRSKRLPVPVQDCSIRDPDHDPRLKHKRADDDQGDEAILGVLLDRSKSDPGHGVNISINNVVRQVTEVLSKSNISDQLLRLSVEEAQCTLDFLQDLLDLSGLSMISKRILLKTSLKLTRIHDCVPRCLMLRGFKKTGDYPFALGHFGELWRGKVEEVEVAVKQARIFTGDNNIKKVLRQVRREAIIWRQCDHPNVLPFYGIYRDSAPSTYCLVSPFMVNGSLRQYMNKTDNPDRHKLEALDIMHGMNYLHTLSIVHGDLKGDNILITDDGRAVIADFGISFVMGVTTFATSSSSSRKGGTVKWQAPEVLSGSPNSFPADVYSLGCVYFEVFDGTIPWGNLREGAVIKNVCFEKKHPPYPKFLVLTRHAGLWWAVMTTCWAYEPQYRPTLLSIMASLHATENMPITESKWDKSVPKRLRDPLVQGKLVIPPGLPRFFGLEDSPLPEVPS
ncbi:kinase-like domain-containing protein [Desarmillaria tabescens]|uniref:Kinase-like domain-containing protein n=1 Tax=Armillaria tabescens TaxID=1929756 RepID=A0AA39JVJ6_ARMTA|nr:kinase-like domain-containing protein [Desarmillaria tabescens]KAK0447358.1 kinase-like domain-containing protein [Desarmillaria tabescens]